MKYIVQINDKRYEVEVERGKATLISTTTVAPAAAPVEPVAAAPVAAAAPAVAAPVAAPVVPGDGTKVEAPMPGTIVKINVSNGQTVKKGEVLVILEAMKMENEILSPVDGVVSQVVVSSGASVSTNDLLIILR